MSRQSERSLGAVVCRLFTVIVIVCLPCVLMSATAASAAPVKPVALTAPVALAPHEGPCNLIPLAPGKWLCNHIPLIPGVTGGDLPSIPGLPNPIKALTQDIVQKVVTELTQAEGDAVSSILTSEMNFINKGTTPTLNAPWYTTQYAMMFGIGIPIAMIMWMMRTTIAVKNQDAADAGKGLIAIIAFFIAGGAMPALVNYAVKIVDGPITQGWLGSAGSSLEPIIKHMTGELTKGNSFGSAILLPLAFLAVGLIGGLITIVELFFREGAIMVFTIAWVITFALWVGGRLTSSFFSRVSWGLGGLIVLKLVMAIILTIGLNLVGTNGQGMGPVIAGMVTCLMVPFISWSAYKAISGHNARPAAWAAKAVTAAKTAIAALG